MSQIFPLEELEIIGCMEVPITQPAMPRLLSPIFAVRNSEIVLFPPYTLCDQEVIRPQVSSREEFNDLLACEEVSAFGPAAALAEHEFWFDDEGAFHYDPSYEAKKKLQSIFEARCRLAKRALETGSASEARAHAMAAYSANPSSLNPLVYRAAAEYRMSLSPSAPEHILEELSLTEILAESHLSIPKFKDLYLTPASNKAKESKFGGIAQRRPKPSQVQFQELAYA